MKNNTKVRLHLSKQLFESLAKQVLAEAKKGDMSGGAYTEAVKAPKGEKKEKAPKAEEPKDKEIKSEAKPAPAAPKTPSTGTQKPGATKGASKQQVAVDLVNKGRKLTKDPKANIQSAEGGRLLDIVGKLIDIADDPNNASMVLDKVTRLIAQNQPKDKLPAPPKEERPGGPFFEIETEVAEGDKIKEALTAETGLIEVGQWAAELLGKTITDEQALKTLGADVLTAATGAAFTGGIGLAMYADNIKAGIKKAAAALKNLAKGGGNVQEGDSDNPLAHLDPKTIAALKK